MRANELLEPALREAGGRREERDLHHPWSPTDLDRARDRGAILDLGNRPLEQRGRPKLVESSAQSHDEELQRRLWAVSEELTGVSFPV